ncbi:unnamed protein product [Vitrella brassicaformis CCMP3155]|uniref:Potassium channel tetramerisation-type BTB domain-containing protein n=1 Tax=Vitrella brassicaformis (strain CCMP3155) TaxID=1169540 RepID=A0A0G4EKI4_VITBC|nr:unnamed protein product [Vitrella brassicaformis CCMP3155]|eukprot:CEL96933.1 unnamed protein product [Vitrella brassicaformis CCMP3155]
MQPRASHISSHTRDPRSLMASESASASARSPADMHLKVGGRAFVLPGSVISHLRRKHPRSVLTVMLSSQWSSSLKRDHEGNIILADWDADSFELLLQRMEKEATDGSADGIKIPSEMRRNYDELCDLVGIPLAKAAFPLKLVKMEGPDRAGTNASWSNKEGKLTIERNGGEAWQSEVGLQFAYPNEGKFCLSVSGTAGASVRLSISSIEFDTFDLVSETFVLRDDRRIGVFGKAGLEESAVVEWNVDGDGKSTGVRQLARSPLGFDERCIQCTCNAGAAGTTTFTLEYEADADESDL